jgi:nucleotide-binding universal stress UspA family protein
MYRTILVPLDGSPFAEHALPLALSIARRAEARLLVAQVHAPLAEMYTERRPGRENTLGPHLRQRDLAYLDRVVQQLAGRSSVSVTSALLDGPISDALHRHALSVDADLVVMSTHGRGPLARAWLGSVADQLVRQLPMPLLLVRPTDAPFDLAGELGREADFRNVLIPLNGSGCAEKILGPAVALARLTGANCTLFEVVESVPIARYGPADPAMAPTVLPFLTQLLEYQEQERAEAEAYLGRVAERLRAWSQPVRTRVAVHEQPAVAILEEARREHAGLIALATAARRGLPRLVLGSVADKVLRAAGVPVLLYRAAEP